MLEWSVTVGKGPWCTHLLYLLTNWECSNVLTEQGPQNINDYEDGVYMAKMVCWSEASEYVEVCISSLHTVLLEDSKAAQGLHWKKAKMQD